MITIEDVCAECRNYFVKSIKFGTFHIAGGEIEPLDFLQEGQYFRIVNSVFNDGVYKYPATDLTDEDFEGAIWAMAVPPAFIALAAEIGEYGESAAAKVSPYTSESFGGYSYTKATNSKGGAVTWQDIFRQKLNKYRRASVL